MTSHRSARRLVRSILIATVLLGAWAYPSAASADTLYAASGGSNNLASLYTLNPTTAVPTLVGPIDVAGIQQTNVTGLAVDPTSGDLYGFRNAPTNNRSDPTFEDGTLLTIDKTNGDAAVVGSIGAAGPLRASDITFDRFGNLYAWSGGCSGTDGCNSNGSDLYTLDTGTGTSTKVSESGTEGFQTGLASDSKGRMYMKSFEGLFRVNPFTGHVFSAMPLTESSRNVASFGPGDTLYTASFNGALQTLNTSTGAVTTIGSTGLNVSAIDWDFTTPTQPDESDLRLDGSVTDSAPTAGTDVTFTLSLVNDGPDSAAGVVVQDKLPSGFMYVSHTASAGTYAPATGLWNVGTVANAAAPTLEIVATVLSSGVHTNPAEVVSDSTTYDTDSTPGSGQGDTFDSTRSAPVGANTLYAATGSGSGFCGGSPSSLYELDPLTGAPAKVADITISGAPVTHVTGLGVDPTDGTLWGFMNFQGSDCDLAGGSAGTLITIDKTTGAATIAGSEGAADIQSPDMTFDPFGDLFAWSTGNTAQDEFDDLYQLDTTTGTSAKVGECDCFSNSTGLAFDSLGRLYEKNSSQLSRMNQFTGQRFSSVFLNQSLHNMLAFGPSDVLYSGRRDEPNQYQFRLKTINPSTAGVTDVGTNSIWTISALAWDLPGLTPPNQVDLSLTKTSDITSPDDWTDHVTFTVTLTNHDLTESATGVTVKDLLPSGLTYVGHTASTGTYVPGTGIWTVGTVAADDSEALEIVVTSNPNSSARTNVAEVVDSTTYDPDSVPGSGDTSGDTYASKTITPTANPAVDGAADVVVNGPSRTTATSKGFTVLVKNVGTGAFTTSTGDLDVAVNGNSGVVTCKPFSATVKPGRQTRVQCSANLDALPLSVGNNVAYSATLNLPGDGFTGNDTDTENRTAS